MINLLIGILSTIITVLSARVILHSLKYDEVINGLPFYFTLLCGIMGIIVTLR